MKVPNAVSKLFGTAALLLAAACGESLLPATKCTSNSGCLTDEVCLTGPGVCTKSCMSQSDCSSASTPSCVAVSGGTGTACQCVAGLNTCGTGRVCDRGACVTGTTPVDAGPGPGCTPSCTSAQVCETTGGTSTCVAKCTWGSCTTGVCNFATGVCSAAAVCVATNAQPDTCNYGKYCGSSLCAEVPKPAASCSNFGANGKPLLWDPAANLGPVIYSITNDSFTADTAFCGAPNTKRSKVTVKAYTTDSANLFPAAKGALGNLTRVNSNGTFAAVDPNAQIQDYVQLQGGKEAAFTLNSCVLPSVSSFSLGLFFTNGNEACFTVN